MEICRFEERLKATDDDAEAFCMVGSDVHERKTERENLDVRDEQVRVLCYKILSRVQEHEVDTAKCKMELSAVIEAVKSWDERVTAC